MMRYHVTVEGHEFQVDLRPDGVSVDGRRVEAGLDGVKGTRVRTLLLDGASWAWDAAGSGSGQWALHAGGRTLQTEVLDDRARTIRALVRKAAGASGPRPLRAPMRRLCGEVGGWVGRRGLAWGQGLVVIVGMEDRSSSSSPKGRGGYLIQRGARGPGGEGPGLVRTSRRLIRRAGKGNAGRGGEKAEGQGGTAPPGPGGELPVEPVYAAFPRASTGRGAGGPRRFPLHPGVYPTCTGRHWTMRQLRRLRHRRGDERPLPLPPGARDHWALRGFRSSPPRWGTTRITPWPPGRWVAWGCAIDSLDDMRTLFRESTWGPSPTSMTINCPAQSSWRCMWRWGTRGAVPRERPVGGHPERHPEGVRGPGDLLYSRGAVPSAWSLPSDGLLAPPRCPAWNTISISGYTSGSGLHRAGDRLLPSPTAWSTWSGALAAGIALEDFAPRTSPSFFSPPTTNFFEEAPSSGPPAASWGPGLMREALIGASDESSRLRFHNPDRGSTLTGDKQADEQRVGVLTTLPNRPGWHSVTGGKPPSRSTPRATQRGLALRHRGIRPHRAPGTQQILAHGRSGVTRTVDPLAGSFFVESLNDALEAEARKPSWSGSWRWAGPPGPWSS